MRLPFEPEPGAGVVDAGASTSTVGTGVGAGTGASVAVYSYIRLCGTEKTFTRRLVLHLYLGRALARWD